jgi:hypothetical protein
MSTRANRIDPLLSVKFHRSRPLGWEAANHRVKLGIEIGYALEGRTIPGSQGPFHIGA